MTHIVVPYHHAEPLPRLTEAFEADAIVVSRGDAGAMVRRVHQQLAARVAASAEPPIVVSGDCTTALSIVAGLQRRGTEPSAIWISAHGDLETPRTTHSGDLCRMGLAMLTGRAGAPLREASGSIPLAIDRCVLAGARELEPGELDVLAATGLRQIATVDGLASAALPPPPWYIQLDLDVLDPAGLPALRFPAPCGPSAVSLGRAVATLAERGPIAAVGLACTLTTAALRADECVAALTELLATILPVATVRK